MGIDKRSAIFRILSASTASWIRMGVTIVTQIALVPIFLNSWTASEYGAWILLQAIWSTITLLDMAHQDYIGYECLRLGKHRAEAISKMVFSALPVTFLIASLDLLVVLGIGNSGYISGLLGINSELMQQCFIALILQAISWVLTGSLGGMMVRWLVVFGHYHKFEWWGVLYYALSALAQSIAVLCGAGIIGVALTIFIITIFYNILMIVSMIGIIRGHNFKLSRPNFTKGIARGVKSLWLAARSLIETSRQQGVRILLAPLVGTTEMVAFATMRTGSNFALQGLATITNPVMPELMNFLASRDQHRMEGMFAVVWFVLVAVLVPTILIIQYIAPALFPVWTHNKISFDPELFGILSVSVLVLALGQPAAAVIQGKNSLKAQLTISTASASLAVLGMLILVPKYGLISAAFSMLLAECLSLACNVSWASKMLESDGLRWPWRSFFTVSASILLSFFSLFFMITLPTRLTFIILVVSLLFQSVILFWYWIKLPILVNNRVLDLIKNLNPFTLLKKSRVKRV